MTRQTTTVPAGAWLFVCARCGKNETRYGGKKSARYCSDRCRKAAFDERKRAEFEASKKQRSLFEPPPTERAARDVSRGVGGAVPPTFVPLDTSSAPISSNSESPPQGALLLPGEGALFVPPASGEIGTLLEMGAWEKVAGCWQRALRFERGNIVLEAYEKPLGGWAGWLTWTSRDGVPFRYSHYIHGERLTDVTLELDVLQGEALARMEVGAVGEGG